MLSAFIHLPKKEMPGFRIRRSAEFSLAEIPPKDPTRVIAIGNILDRGEDTGNLYYIDVDALQKHTIVCGVTGGGKTNTCFYLARSALEFRHSVYGVRTGQIRISPHDADVRIIQGCRSGLLTWR
jgi:hypothetical protein